MNKATYIKVLQKNGFEIFINPFQIVTIYQNKIDSKFLEFEMSSGRMFSINLNEPENKEISEYLDLDGKKVL